MLSPVGGAGYRRNPHQHWLGRHRAPLVALGACVTDYHVRQVRLWELHCALPWLGREVVVAAPGAFPGDLRAVEWPQTGPALWPVILRAPWDREFLVDVGPASGDERGPREAEGVEAEAPSDAVAAACIDDEFLAVSHLVGRGHRRIGLLTVAGWPGTTHGYEHALEHANIAERFAEALEDEMEPGAAEMAAVRLFTATPGVTALLCSSPELAGGAMRALYAIGAGPSGAVPGPWDGGPAAPWGW
jgi:hypothetical protein